MPNRNQGRYSASQGFSLPAEGFTGTPDVPCPDGVGPDARAWWATWATSRYAHHFISTEWQDLADTARIMDRFYAGESRALSEARQHQTNLFGLATRMRMHISVDQPASGSPTVPASKRADPRLRSA